MTSPRSSPLQIWPTYLVGVRIWACGPPVLYMETTGRFGDAVDAHRSVGRYSQRYRVAIITMLSRGFGRARVNS